MTARTPPDPQVDQDDDARVVEVETADGIPLTREDIDKPDVYAEHMHGKVLYDNLLREITAARKSDRARAYFRLRKGYVDDGRADPGEKDKLHDETIRRIHARLVAADSIEVRTTKWSIDGKPSDHTLWHSHPLRKLTWKLDPLTRIWIDQKRYFQPDITGSDPRSPYASPKNPWILLEVIHHHWPEETAWRSLLALSSANHLVVFYFVKGEESNNWVNRTFGQTPFVMKVSFYLLDGELYHDSKKIKPPPGTSNQAKWIKLHIFAKKDAILARERSSKEER
jgi:hypothetical protein